MGLAMVVACQVAKMHLGSGVSRAPDLQDEGEDAMD
jgi:hypothetical protein